MTIAARVASIGECMIELRQSGPAEMAFGFGGDTLNMAVYLARLGGPRLSVHYVTALGDDAFSASMLQSWEAEGIRTDCVLRLPDRLPGLYVIHTDEQGERSFSYWRSAAAARDMLRAAGSERIAGALPGFDVVFLSGISLSILDCGQRQRLLELLGDVRRRGGRVVFDSNYRKRGWTDASEAARLFEQVVRLCDIVLPSLDDEQALFADADAQACARRIRQLGPSEVVVKMGKEGSLISAGEIVTDVAAEEIPKVVDTTAAGDSFNAGYLAGRLLGRDPVAAAKLGARLAAIVVQHPGAIVPVSSMAGLSV